MEHEKSVEVKIKPIYKGSSQRPTSFEIKYKVGKENGNLLNLIIYMEGNNNE
nr:DNA/RNA non-specific endonuclease [Bacillus sp. WMMC1349]